MSRPLPPAEIGGAPRRDLREEAHRRAARLRALYVHACAFVLGNSANVVVNWVTLGGGNNGWWFQFPLVAWSVALGVHAIAVLSRGAWFGADWEERKVRRYLTDHAAAQRGGTGSPIGEPSPGTEGGIAR